MLLNERSEIIERCLDIVAKAASSKEELEQAIEALITLFPKEHVGIKMYLTGGESKDAFTSIGSPSFWMVASEIRSLPFYEAIHLKTIPYSREWPDIKSINYMRASIYAKRHHADGYHDIIYMNKQDELLESSTSNLFFFKGNKLITAKDDILKGITREVVVYLAKNHFEIEYRNLNLKELEEVDECFVTSTTKEICPVNKVDGFEFRSNHPKAKTIFLKQLFQEYINSSEKPIFQLEFDHSSSVSSSC